MVLKTDSKIYLCRLLPYWVLVLIGLLTNDENYSYGNSYDDVYYTEA